MMLDMKQGILIFWLKYKWIIVIDFLCLVSFILTMPLNNELLEVIFFSIMVAFHGFVVLLYSNIYIPQFLTFEYISPNPPDIVPIISLISLTFFSFALKKIGASIEFSVFFNIFSQLFAFYFGTYIFINYFYFAGILNYLVVSFIDVPVKYFIDIKEIWILYFLWGIIGIIFKYYNMKKHRANLFNGVYSHITRKGIKVTPVFDIFYFDD